MIEINLLPPDLKTKEKKAPLRLESKQILFLIPLLFGILVIIHVYLGGMLAIKNLQLGGLNNKWQKLMPQRKILEDFRKEYGALSGDAKLIEQLNSQRINWSEKLNRLSLRLPSGVWFNEISVTPEGFILKASAISLQKEEMSLINKFIDNLKNDAGFFKDFNNLELSSAQRKVIGGYDIIEFILGGALKSR